MRLSKEETLKHLLEDEELFVLYSASPDAKKMADTKAPALTFRNPYLTEEALTHRTQVMIYDTNDACMEAVKQRAAERILCMSIRFQKDNYRSMYLNLAETGADSVVYHTGEDTGEVLLKEEKIQELMGLKDVLENQRDLSRDLQLYWQQVNQNAMAPEGKVTAPAKEMEGIRYTALLGSMMRAMIILPVVPDQNDPKKFGIPIMQQKTADGKPGEKQLLGFTNVMEASRYFNGKMPNCRFFNISDIAMILKNQADILVLNQATSMCRMTATMLERVKENQAVLKAVADGTREQDAESVKIHLRTDRAYFAIYTALLHRVADREQPQIELKNPYIYEDEETYNDQFRVFADQEEAVAYAKKVLEEKKLYVIVREIRTLEFPKLYTTLASKDVTSIVYCSNGKEFELELSELVQLPDYSNLEENARPLTNPTLELSAQYYWQEMYRRIPLDQRTEEEMQALTERSEEFLANLIKSDIYVYYTVEERDGQKVQAFPMIVKKDAEGKVVSAEYQLFTDFYELRAYFKGNIPTIARMPFTKISELLIESCTGVIFDPAGVDLHYKKEAIQKLLSM